ncbi:hypothetical protein CANARDRAFT_28480 [[Candida] arabinofermentans NRRL YB-2248]|uniref:F-box domain-containing protein n=1 Tax=[Candida] arabinofermentans NRRL YB-2248 TaxID=983967 RepID=A0A1E4T093_9ASCO|nr:hypothetical protein CANARDRAFT_28480 [[Candida] arabinofermentans NRRL YB-2248]
MENNIEEQQNSSSVGSMSSLGSHLPVGRRESEDKGLAISTLKNPTLAISDDEMNDPDTDNEQHARKLILRSKARSTSITSLSMSSFPYGSFALGPISVLPPEILCVIFSYLNSKSDLLSVALTCRYWADLIIEPIWFRPGISRTEVFEKLRRVMSLPKEETAYDYRKYIKRLNLSLVPHLVTDDYLKLFIGSTNLERITLVNCSNLGHVNISGILKGCSRLQSIDLSGVRDIQDDIYYELSNNCKRLQGLYAPGSSKVSKAAVLAVVRNCPLLKRVKLSDCNEVDDEVLDNLVDCCPNLVEVELHGCEKVTNKSLNKLFAQLEFLKEFKISKNSNISYQCFESTSGSQLCLERLRILDLTQCNNITDKAVEMVIKLAPRLRNVLLSKCTAITDRSLRAIATLGKNLHYVHLGHCSNITDFGAKDLIKSCFRLQYIDLACCTQLTNETVQELSMLPRLRRIGLVKCSQITDDGIIALASYGRNGDDTLERVHLSYCMNLTVYPIYKLLKACPKLTHISLTGVSQFLRPDITQFCRDPPSEFNPQQKSIFCVFSGEGVAQLREHLRSLYETPQSPEGEGMEVLEIITTIIEHVDEVNERLFEDNIQRERLRLFVETTDHLVNHFYQLNVPRAHLTLFAKCVLTRLPTEHVPRVQRFFQLMQLHPIQQQQRQQAQPANNRPVNAPVTVRNNAVLLRQDQLIRLEDREREARAMPQDREDQGETTQQQRQLLPAQAFRGQMTIDDDEIMEEL